MTKLFDPGLTITSSPTEPKLISGDFPRAMQTVVILSGQNLVRGALLGKVTASGKYVLSLSASSDGSQTPIAVLADDCNASAADKRAGVYFTGEFDPAYITFGTGHTSASTFDGLLARSIFLKSKVPA